MTNVLGGGGGKEGFKHILTHLGPGITSWKRDMDKNAFEISTESIGELDSKVQVYLSQIDPITAEHQRDEILIDTIKRKKEESALA